MRRRGCGSVNVGSMDTPSLRGIASARPRGLLLPLLLLAGPAAGSAQQSPAATYLDRYHELASLAPVPGRLAAVTQLTLRRDAAQITFDRGTLYLLSPVGGRTVAAVFRGTGRFTLAPAVPAEQA